MVTVSPSLTLTTLPLRVAAIVPACNSSSNTPRIILATTPPCDTRCSCWRSLLSLQWLKYRNQGGYAVFSELASKLKPPCHLFMPYRETRPMAGIIAAVKPASNGVAASRVRIRIPLPTRIAPLPVLHHPINSNAKKQHIGENADYPEGAHRFPFRCLSGQGVGAQSHPVSTTGPAPSPRYRAAGAARAPAWVPPRQQSRKARPGSCSGKTPG